MTTQELGAARAAAPQSSEKREPINGVFSSQEVKKVGTGTTTRKTIQKTFWFCMEQDDGSIEVQPLNPNYVPSGPKKKVEREHFLTTFAPEPELYVSSVYPKMRELNKTVARADRYRQNKEYYSAEMEYNTALKVDEENVRANFGLGITYLDRGEKGKADSIFERLVKLDAAFDKEHKHLFNEFGINLRKNGMLDQAISYYTRAMELEGQDEHLYHNLARAYLEKKDIKHAAEYLFKSLELNPSLETSVKFLLWLEEKKLIPAEYRSAADALLQTAKKEGVSSPAAEEGS
jgi:tetratricopeptide (TPR) repeat protein